MSVRSNARVVVVDPDAGSRAALVHACRNAGGHVDGVRSVSDLAATGRPTTVVVAYDRLPSEEREALSKARAVAPAEQVVLLSRELGLPELRDWFARHVAWHVLAVDPQGRPQRDDLRATLEILGGRAFELGAFFPHSVRSATRSLGASGEREDALSWAAKYCDDAGHGARVRVRVQGLLDELLTNALFNAPTDERGRKRFASHARTTDVTLAGNERVEVELASDAERVGVCVTDPFGSLDPVRTQDALAQCMKREGAPSLDRTSGAGLGLYHLLEGASHFAIHVQQGVRTRCAALVDLQGPFRVFGARSRSFNLFASRGGLRSAA